MEYLDFELEIQSGNGPDYPVAVLHSPAGEARAMMHFPFDQYTLENRLDKLQIALLRSGGKRRNSPSDEERAVQAFGQALFEAVFIGEVRTRYDLSCEHVARAGQGLRLKLRIHDPKLATLPWEFLYDPRQEEYVCLSRNTPILRYLELPQRIKSLRVESPLRILGVIASPTDLEPLDVAREKERMKRAVAELSARGLVELTWMEGQTWRDLQREMQGGPWHILHFVGHGGFDSAHGEGYICLAEDDRKTRTLSAVDLARLLADHQSLRMVLLNACEGARGSERDVFSSTASILVRRGIPAVLAMQYEITDRAAIEFARAFYEALARNLPVDTAVSEARKAICLDVPNTVEWGTPVLHMRAPDGVLFDLVAAASPAKSPMHLADQSVRPGREVLPRPTWSASKDSRDSTNLHAGLMPERLSTGRTGQVQIENRGSITQEVHIRWQDPAEELVFQPAQIAVVVKPRETSTVSFSVRPLRRRWVGSARAHPFAVHLNSPQTGPQIAPLTGQVVSRGLVPVWLPPLFMLAFVALAILVRSLISQPPIVEEGRLEPATSPTALAIAAAPTATATADLRATADMIDQQTQIANSTASAPASTQEAMRIAAATTTAVWLEQDDDSDDLTNREEQTLGTLPYRADTDEDGLNDGVELRHSTDPLDSDTDDDGLTDGVEVDRGINPLNHDTDGDGTPDARDQVPDQPPTATPKPTDTPQPTSTPRPTDTPVPTPTPLIEVWSNSYQVTRGQCTALHWNMQNVSAVYLNDAIQVSQGLTDVCPSTTTTYIWRIKLPNGSEDTRPVTITVIPRRIAVPIGDLTWYAKDDRNNTMNMGDASVQITAGATSHPNFPKFIYPESGDLEITVRVDSPFTDSTDGARVAGIGIESLQTGNCVILGKSLNRGGQDIRSGGGPEHDGLCGEYLGDSRDCVDDYTYLRIVKRGKSISLSCSLDGSNWITEGLRQDYLIDFGDNFSVFLFAWSTDTVPITASFSEFTVIK